jgi:hypothetical protein
MKRGWTLRLCANVRADEKLPAFPQVETAIHQFAVDVMS